MDLKTLLLFLFVTFATSSKCGWKKPAYFGMMFELMWQSNKETICDAIHYFNRKMERSKCFNQEERLIFEALKESCGSKCNLHEVARKGKALAFQLSLNARTKKACKNFPAMKHLLKKLKCHELYDVLRQLLFYCDDEAENPFDLLVDINAQKNPIHTRGSEMV